MKNLLLCLLVAASGCRADATGSTPAREGIEWCDIWISHANETNLPRVLLIGDSITRGYYPAVEKQLAGKACVARLTTSASPDMNCSGNFSTDKRGGTLAIIVTFPLENKQA